MSYIVEKQVTCNTCTNDNCKHGNYYILRDSKGNHLESLGKDEDVTVESVASKLDGYPVSRKDIFKIDEVRTSDVIDNINQLDVRPDYQKESPWGRHEKQLNNLVNRQGINDPNKTVTISTVVREHNIEEDDEVIDQFNNHKDGKCDVCGEHNEYGDFNKLVNEMYSKQQAEFGYKMYSGETCNKYLYDLFTRKTIDGVAYEKEAIKTLSDVTEHNFREPTTEEDSQYAVDIVVEHGKIGEEFAGIQVKPVSYDEFDDKKMVIINKQKNNDYEHNVFYLYYDKEKDDFINLDKIKTQLNV